MSTSVKSLPTVAQRQAATKSTSCDTHTLPDATDGYPRLVRNTRSDRIVDRLMPCHRSALTSCRRQASHNLCAGAPSGLSRRNLPIRWTNVPTEWAAIPARDRQRPCTLSAPPCAKMEPRRGSDAIILHRRRGDSATEIL